MKRALALVVLMLGGCSRSAPFVVLTVDAPDDLAVRIVGVAAGLSAEELESTELATVVFPVAITVTATDVGEQQLWVEGRDHDGLAVARGQVTARFARTGRPSASLQLVRACDQDATCSDGVFCNGADICDAGVCVTLPPACGSSVACVVSTCVELGSGDGRCDVVVDHAGCGASNYCNPTLGCVPGLGCFADAECQDDSICNGDERCLNYGCASGMRHRGTMAMIVPPMAVTKPTVSFTCRWRTAKATLA